MFYIYADGKLLNQPLEDSLVVMTPRLILEMGKAGSLEFALPPNNVHYQDLRKLKTLVTVDLDDTELFRGRVLSHDRNFNNVKKIYAEGDLAYLVDSVQKPDKYSGTTHGLFRQIISAHNAQMDPQKRFEVGTIGIENREIVISGQSEDIEDLETGGFDYRQIAINSTSSDWLTTYDYIESCLIEYCGGYLRTRKVGNTIYLDLVTNYGSTATQEIEIGTNLLDLTEEATAEEVFTVLIPIGDENLTIASVNGGSEELVDVEAVALYGRIVKTRVFENVNQASTLLENAQRFVANHENVPITFTIRAIDFHLVDPDVQEIHVGDSVRVKSVPHGISGMFTCTRIEYDLENPANNTYTFGNPKQTLTQRYRKDKRKEEKDSSGGGGGGGSSGAGGAGSAAEDKAQENLDKFYDAWINVDPESGHVDLGALYKELKDGKDVLKQEVGIDLDAPTGHVNIYSLRDHVNEVDGRITQNSAEIDLWATELKSQIDAHVGWSEEFEGKTEAWHAQLILEANNNGEAIAALTSTYESHMANLELRVSSQEAKALLKATYDANRTADLVLVSNLESAIATLSASHSGRLASLEARADETESSVVMKAEYLTKMAFIEAKVTEQGSQISINADTITTKASSYQLNVLNTKVVGISADLVEINAAITSVRKLVADDIEALKGDVTWLKSKQITVTGLVADNLYANNYVSSPIIRMNGALVATERYVNDKVANLVDSTWVNNQGFATQSYVNDRNAWGSSTETGKFWLTVGGSSKVVALGNHAHSNYCTEARVNELIAAATIAWSRISGKPSSFYPSSHRHSFGFTKSIANGHTHKTTVGGTTYTSTGVSTNATHSLDVGGYTGYSGG